MLPSIFEAIPDDTDFEDKLEQFISSDFSFLLKPMVISDDARIKYFGTAEPRMDWSGEVPDGQGQLMEVIVVTPLSTPAAVAHRNDLAIKLAGVRGSPSRWLVLCYCKLTETELCKGVWSAFDNITMFQKPNQALISTFKALSVEEKESIAAFVSAIFNHENEPKFIQEMQSQFDSLHKSHKERPCAFKPEVIASINEAMNTQTHNHLHAEQSKSNEPREIHES